MKYLVTGAAGFIGSNLVDELLIRGHEVIGYDNFSTGQERYLNEALKNPRFRLIRGDLLDVEGIKRAMYGVDTVYHLAANADIRGGLADPKIDIEQNTIATFNVLEAMRIANARKIVFASSAAALGEPLVFPTPENCAIPNQTSFYGASKMAGEGLISAYCQGYGFEGYAFRFVSLLGPRYPHGHVYDFLKQLLVDPTRLKVLGDGTAQKSYLHIGDCINALMLICEELEISKKSKDRFEVFHLGRDEYCEVRQSIAWICEELKISPELNFGVGQKGWIGDNPFVYLDTIKARTLGWEAKKTIEQSIKETVKWLVENSWIFKSRN